MKTTTKAPVGRPLTTWDFIFSPEKFDKEIGLEQFSGECPALEQMQDLGIKASLVRQDLIERAQKVGELFQFDEDANEIYKKQLQKKLDKNVHGHERYYLSQLTADLPAYEYQTKPYKRRKLRDLSIEEQIEMAEDMFRRKDYHQNICA